MRNKKKKTAALESYNKTLIDLRNVFLNVTVGDYSGEVVFPETENTQSEIHYGVKLLYDTIREKVDEIEKLKQEFKKHSHSDARPLNAKVNNPVQSTWRWLPHENTIVFSEESARIFDLPEGENRKMSFGIFLSLIKYDQQDGFLEKWKRSKNEKVDFLCLFDLSKKPNKTKSILMWGKVETDSNDELISLHGTIQNALDYPSLFGQPNDESAESGVEVIRHRTITSGSTDVSRSTPFTDDPPTEKPKTSVLAESNGNNALTGLEEVYRKRINGETDYQMILDSLHTAIVSVDKDGIIEYVNGHFLNLFGFETGEVLGALLNGILINLPGNDPKPSNNIKFHLGNETMELRLKKKDGSLFWAQIHKIPLLEKQSMLFTIKDIDKIKKYESKLNTAADFSMENPNPLLRYSISEQRFISGNKAAKHLMKYFHSEKNIKATEELKKKISQFYETKKIAQEEIKVNKQTFLFIFVSVKNEKYVNIYGNDITAIKRAESEIRRLLFILSKTDNSVIIADKNGLIQWVNDGFERLCGYMLNEVKGTSGEILRKGKSTGLDPHNTYFQRMIQTKQSVSYESKNYAKSGTEFWAFTTLTPVLNADGEIDCIVAVDSDITLKKKAEKQMILAMKYSAESAMAKQHFLANMSHEIRTPMNGIMGIIQLLRDTRLDEKQKEYLKSMEFAGENLLSIVNDVLDLSKIESGKMKVEKMTFDPRVLIHELIKSMMHLADEKFLKLNVHIDEKLPSALIGDPLRLNQILTNLLSNSIKFTDEGEITITIGFETTTEGSLLEMTIKDTGIGIPKEKQQLIFDEFEQAHTGNKKLYGGTGLGLSIVKKLVTIMNGKMIFKSTVGIGTEFKISIPIEVSLHKSEIKEIADINDNDKKILSHKKLLLVEDNKLNQMVAERFLTKMGADVVTAENGLEAIRILKSDEFDAILMDIQMPEMNGYETTKYIREKFGKEKRNIPILAMTAHALAGEEKKCIDAGMHDYISKPLIRENLEKMLINLFKKYGNQVK